MTDKNICKRLKLTEAELAELRAAARRTWQVIGYDVLEASGGRISRADIIECVLDADYIVTNVPKISKPVRAALSAYTEYATLVAALKGSFYAE